MVFGLYGLSFVKHYLPQNDTVVIPDTVYKMIAVRPPATSVIGD